MDEGGESEVSTEDFEKNQFQLLQKAFATNEKIEFWEEMNPPK